MDNCYLAWCNSCSCYQKLSTGLPWYCNSAWRRNPMKTSASLALCQGNPPLTTGFPTQRTSNVECISISWHHDDMERKEWHLCLQNKQSVKCWVVNKNWTECLTCQRHCSIKWLHWGNAACITNVEWCFAPYVKNMMHDLYHMLVIWYKIL